MTTAPRSVTVGVRDLDKALDLFHRRLDLDMDESGAVPKDVLAAWGLPDVASARYALLSRDGYQAGKIRLVETDLVAQHVVRDDLIPGGSDSPFDIGPKALDFYIPDDMPSAVAALEEAGYPLINGPADYQMSGLIEAMHTGPDGVSLVLMTRPTGASGDMRANLPPGMFSEVVSISVISASRDQSALFYGELLQLPKTLDREASPQIAQAVSLLNGLPPDTRVHWQMYVEDGQPSAKMILVHYPGNVGKRLVGRMQPGRIGVCLYSLERPDVTGFSARAKALGFAVEREPVKTAWGRLALVRGPNEELIEVIEGETQ